MPLSFSLAVSLFPSRFCFSPRDFVVYVFFGLQKIKTFDENKKKFCSGHLTCRFLGLIRHLGRYTPLVMSWSIQKAYGPLACSRSSARRRIRRRLSSRGKERQLVSRRRPPPFSACDSFFLQSCFVVPFPFWWARLEHTFTHLLLSPSLALFHYLVRGFSICLSLARFLACFLPLQFRADTFSRPSLCRTAQFPQRGKGNGNQRPAWGTPNEHFPKKQQTKH